MYSIADKKIIKFALERRLDSEPGFKIMETIIEERADKWIGVGVLWLVDDKVLGRSRFHLPPEFHLRVVHNQADEIAEQAKEARKRMRFTGAYLPELGAVSETFTAKGTGLRGHLAQSDS